MGKRRKEAGFSIIESIVVTTIIGILASVAVPKFMVAKDNATNSQVQSNAHAIQLGVEQYAVDNGGNYPTDAADMATKVVADINYVASASWPITPWKTRQTGGISWPANQENAKVGDAIGTGSLVNPAATTHFGAVSYLWPVTGKYYVVGTGKHDDKAVVSAVMHN